MNAGPSWALVRKDIMEALRRGGLHIAVANAGRGTFSTILDHPLEEWLAILDLCLTGVFLTVQQSAKVMCDGGSIITISSLNGTQPAAGMGAYCTAKAGVIMLTQVAAMELGDRGIRVSVLCPQSVQTGMTTPGPSAARVDGVLQAPEVARMVLEAMEAERFLILSHPQVHDYMQRKASNAERWLTGMRRLRDRIYGGQG